MNTRGTMLVGAMVMSAATAQITAADSAEQAVIAAEHQIEKALLTNNAELFAQLVTDKYVSTDENGEVAFGKAPNVADFKVTIFTSEKFTDLTVTMYGDAAVATGTYTSKGTYKGKPFDHTGRFTDTWVKLDGKWLCAADHESLIPSK